MEYYWLYGAVEPRTGEAFFVEMPRLDGGCFSAFLRELAQAYPTTHNVVVLDNAPAHIAGYVAVPTNVTLLELPPYSPELNPVERVWLAVRRRVDVYAEAVRTSLDGLREAVAAVVCALEPSQVRSLSSYGYIRAAWEALK